MVSTIGHGTYDSIIMNPPFTQGQDCEHVRHAFKFLRLGGRLVSVMTPAWQTNATKKFKAFREWLANLNFSVEVLPSGTFSESGTEVNAVILTIRN